MNSAHIGEEDLSAVPKLRIVTRLLESDIRGTMRRRALKQLSELMTEAKIWLEVLKKTEEESLDRARVALLKKRRRLLRLRKDRPQFQLIQGGKKDDDRGDKI